MAKNDAILLDGIIEKKMIVEMLGKGETFELFAFEQILKSFDLTRDEIDSGWVDGKDDGGIDGFYTFLNGVLLSKLEGYKWPKKGVVIDIWILSCKHHDTFKQEPINTLFPTIEELLDFSKGPSDFEAHYSNELIAARQIAVQAFLQTAAALSEFNFHFGYASRGDLRELGDNIDARGNQLKRIVSDYFSASTVSLEYFGAAELIALHRKNRFVLELPFIEKLESTQGAFVLLVDLQAYARFVSDENGNLRRYIFDSNIRDFLGENRVNDDISSTLKNSMSPDFWWLNNGVTILSTNAALLGKTHLGNTIQLHDVQIVNGLQTTQSIFNHFKNERESQNNRQVLIKIIVSDDSLVRDQIIQATNNQSVVELSSLNATDKIQRDIEDILERHGWYYERRKNYYKNIGKPLDRFVLPIFLASAYISLVKKAPHKAGIIKTKFMRNPRSYESVFSERTAIEIWPSLVRIVKAVEVGMIKAALKSAKTSSGHLTVERNFGSWRGAVALCVVAKILGTFDYPVIALVDIDIEKIPENLIEETFLELRKFPHSRAVLLEIFSSSSANNDARCRVFCENHRLSGIEAIGHWVMPKGQLSKSNFYNKSPAIIGLIDEEIINLVDASLPSQPWPSGVQSQVSELTGLDKKLVQECVNLLIKEGKRHQQRDGVVFGKDKIIIAVDPRKADPRFVVGEKYN